MTIQVLTPTAFPKIIRVKLGRKIDIIFSKHTGKILYFCHATDHTHRIELSYEKAKHYTSIFLNDDLAVQQFKQLVTGKNKNPKFIKFFEKLALLPDVTTYSAPEPIIEPIEQSSFHQDRSAAEFIIEPIQQASFSQYTSYLYATTDLAPVVELIIKSTRQLSFHQDTSHLYATTCSTSVEEPIIKQIQQSTFHHDTSHLYATACSTPAEPIIEPRQPSNVRHGTFTLYNRAHIQRKTPSAFHCPIYISQIKNLPL
jgi:hypothetical protein